MPRLAGNKKFERYIVDFAICSDSPQTEGTWNLSKIKVIELNPFLYSTDPALFSWQKERVCFVPLSFPPFLFDDLIAPSAFS